MHDDLRGWLKKAEKLGKVKHITGAHWDREMACLAELFCYRKKLETPALLFEDIPGIKKGYRVLFHELITPWAAALAIGIEPKYESLVDLVTATHEKIEHLPLIPPQYVNDGPILENVHRGDDVHLLDLPVPRFSEFDGGRYIGTSDVVIVKDPDSGYINLGTYRMQLYDDNSCALFISPGKHANIIRQKYFDRGLPCPVAVCLGQDPSIMLFASNEVPYGVGEYDLVGGIKGQAVKVVKGPETGLPIPAAAEIVIEGYCYPNDTMPEGPFPEWTGYYGSSSRAEPVMRVKALLHRNDPILTARHEIRGKSFDFRGLMRSALLWKELQTAGIPEVKGVWRYEQAGTRFFNVISIKQSYYGHARQTLHVAAQTTSGAYAGRWVVVVDDDIDPANIDQVMWAMSTRCQPSMDIEFINRTRSTPLDPMCFDKQKNYYTSLALVDACIPYEEKKTFPRAAGATPEYMKEIGKKWSSIFE